MSSIARCTSRLLIFLPVLFAATPAMAQHPEMQWQQELGGEAGDMGNAILQTKDTGYIVAGTSYSASGDVKGNHGNGDIWVAKLNQTGNIQWQKALGGSENERGFSIAQTYDGGYIVAGTTNSVDGDVRGRTTKNNFDCWVVKMDKKGNILWQKALGGEADDMAYAIVQTYDGNYILAGVTKSKTGDVSGYHTGSGYDGWVVKLDEKGNIMWQKCLGGSRLDILNSIALTNDGGYIVAGATSSGDADGNVHGHKKGNGLDCWVVRLNDSGSISWQKVYGGTGYDQATAIKQINDGGYILCGNTTSDNGDVTGYHGGTDGWVAKLDGKGAIVWQKAMGGRRDDGINDVIQTSDNGYVIVGYAASDDGDIGNNRGAIDMWAVKLQKDGSFEWQKPLGGSGNEKGHAIVQTTDKGYIIAGTTESGDGDAKGNHGNEDVWVVKLGSPFRDMPVFNKNVSGITVFPEQTNDIIYLGLPREYKGADISITDVNGNKVEFSDTQSYYRIIHILKAAPGLLTLHIVKGDKEQTFNVTYQP